MTTPAPEPKLSSFQRWILALLALLVVAVVAVAVVVAVTARSAEVEQKKLACKKWQSGSLDYFTCMDEADD